MLKPRRIEEQRPGHPRTCQVDRHIVVAADGGEPALRNMSWPTCRLSAARAGPESLRRCAPVQSSWPPMWAPGRRTAPRSPLPVAVNPWRRNMFRLDLQAVGGQGGPGVIVQLRPVKFELAADVGADQADRAVTGAPVAVKHAEEHGPADLQAVGEQGGPGVVAQLRPGAVEVTADVGAVQADRAALSVADGPCPG